MHGLMLNQILQTLFADDRSQEGLQSKLVLLINNGSNCVDGLAKVINLIFLTCIVLVKI